MAEYGREKTESKGYQVKQQVILNLSVLIHLAIVQGGALAQSTGWATVGSSDVAYEPLEQGDLPFIDTRTSELPACQKRTTNAAGQLNLFDEVSILFAVDGSKQPQDFGVNANLGRRAP